MQNSTSSNLELFIKYTHTIFFTYVFSFGFLIKRKRQSKFHILHFIRVDTCCTLMWENSCDCSYNVRYNGRCFNARVTSALVTILYPYPAFHINLHITKSKVELILRMTKSQTIVIWNIINSLTTVQINDFLLQDLVILYKLLNSPQWITFRLKLSKTVNMEIMEYENKVKNWILQN